MASVYSVELSSKERGVIYEEVEKYARTQDGLWLNNMNYREYPLLWSKFMTTYDEGSVLGSYTWYTGKIKLQWNESLECDKSLTWCKLMAPTLIHELWHARQFKKNPIVYVLATLLTFTGARERCLEVSAREQGEKAEAFLGKDGY